MEVNDKDVIFLDSTSSVSGTSNYYFNPRNLYQISVLVLFIGLVLLFYVIVHWILLCRNRQSTDQFQHGTGSRTLRGMVSIVGINNEVMFRAPSCAKCKDKEVLCGNIEAIAENPPSYSDCVRV